MSKIVTNLDVHPEPIKAISTEKIGITIDDKDNERNDFLLVITPDQECVGVKIKYGMPESFDTEQSRREWLQQAVKRAIDLKNQI